MSKVLKFIVLACFICVNTLSYSQAKWVSLDNNSKEAEPTFSVLTSDESTYQVKVKIHGYYDEVINEGSTTYHKIFFGNGYTTTNIGYPAIPVISRLIAIPNNSICSSYISENKWVDVNIGRIYPFQRPLLETEKSSKFDIDDEVYGQDVYKTFLINRADTNIWRDIRNIAYSICPFKYYPKSGKLSVLTEFVFTVKFSPKTDISRSVLPRKKISLFDNDLVIPSNVETTDNLGTTDNTRATDNISYDYLIIIGDKAMYQSRSLKFFCKWKAIKGHKTKIVSTEVTGTTSSSIKKYIKNEYNSNKDLSYVLFIGDDDRIPLHNMTISNSGDFTKGDYWYGCMDGENDIQADIAIGRFSANVESELKNMVDKTIKYESSYNQYAQYAQLIANKEEAPGKYQQCCEDIRTAIYNTPFSFIKTYGASTSNGGTNSTNDDIISRINQGVNIVNYRGHGDWDEWWNWNVANQCFYNSDVDALHNTTYPVVFSIACTTADIRNHTCLMETFMKSKYGSAAYLGATLPSYTWANHSFDRLLFKELLDDNVVNAGFLNIAAHIKNMAETEHYTSETNAFIYIWGSDPALEIWTQKPQTFKNVFGFKSTDGVHIVVHDVDNYMVSVVSKEGELRYKNTYSSNSIILPEYDDGDVVYLNKHNYIPLEVKINNTIYIQNKIITGNEIFNGTKIDVGYDVTPSVSKGNVVVKSGANMELNSSYETVIKNGFECQQGATLIIK